MGTHLKHNYFNYMQTPLFNKIGNLFKVFMCLFSCWEQLATYKAASQQVRDLLSIKLNNVHTVINSRTICINYSIDDYGKLPKPYVVELEIMMAAREKLGGCIHGASD